MATDGISLGVCYVVIHLRAMLPPDQGRYRQISRLTLPLPDVDPPLRRLQAHVAGDELLGLYWRLCALAANTPYRGVLCEQTGDGLAALGDPAIAAALGRTPDDWRRAARQLESAGLLRRIDLGIDPALAAGDTTPAFSPGRRRVATAAPGATGEELPLFESRDAGPASLSPRAPADHGPRSALAPPAAPSPGAPGAGDSPSPRTDAPAAPPVFFSGRAPPTTAVDLRIESNEGRKRTPFESTRPSGNSQPAPVGRASVPAAAASQAAEPEPKLAAELAGWGSADRRAAAEKVLLTVALEIPRVAEQLKGLVTGTLDAAAKRQALRDRGALTRVALAWHGAGVDVMDRLPQLRRLARTAQTNASGPPIAYLLTAIARQWPESRS